MGALGRTRGSEKGFGEVLYVLSKLLRYHMYRRLLSPVNVGDCKWEICGDLDNIYFSVAGV